MFYRKEKKERLSLFRGVVKTIQKIIEVREPFTAAHQMRVGKIARLIAAEMGLSPLEQDLIEIGGMIHDIGKMTLPTTILWKKAPLSQNELVRIRSHPLLGYEILKDARFPLQIYHIVLQHHERLDGSGYPEGIKGELISLEARIVAVADVLEAMSAPRPYRKTPGMKAAIEEIKRGKGILYDAEVVEAALQVLKNIKL